MERVGEFCVHGEALLDGEGLELRQTKRHYDCAAENRYHTKNYFCILNLGDSA